LLLRSWGEGGGLKASSTPLHALSAALYDSDAGPAASCSRLAPKPRRGRPSGRPWAGRAIAGSYHQLSAKHLPSYLDEVSFKYNNRENDHLFRDTLTAPIATEALEYKQLIAS